MVVYLQDIHRKFRLMVEEIQSDLHQRGQEYGYAKPNALEDINTQIDAYRKQRDALDTEAVSTWAEENMPDVYKKAYTFDGSVTSEESIALRRKMINASFFYKCFLPPPNCPVGLKKGTFHFLSSRQDFKASFSLCEKRALKH